MRLHIDNIHDKALSYKKDNEKLKLTLTEQAEKINDLEKVLKAKEDTQLEKIRQLELDFSSQILRLKEEKFELLEKVKETQKILEKQKKDNQKLKKSIQLLSIAQATQ